MLRWMWGGPRQHGHKDAVALLIDRGAAFDKGDINGRTPLFFSAHVSVNMLARNLMYLKFV